MHELKTKNGFNKPATKHDCDESIDPTQPERPYIVVKGCTGAGNETEDMTCIVSERVILNAGLQSHVIVVAFHGSTSKNEWSKLLRLFSVGFLGEHDDWESNTKFAGIPASDLGISNCVLFHGGYLKNYTSVHEKLICILSDLLLARTDISMERKRVIFTGHSKGGGMATVGGCIATYALKAHDQNKFKDVKFGIFAVSSPRVFQGDESREWAQSTMGCIQNGASRNIIRINVEGDIVPLLPLKAWCFGACDFRHVGYSYTETRHDLIERMAELHPTFKKASRWNIIANISFEITVIQLLHYAHNFTANFGNFDSSIIIDFYKWKDKKLRIQVANHLGGTPEDDQFNPYATF